MRCRTCDYRLWNIRSRQCPECGTAFLPGEYTFLPNSVQFHCPHCNQVYYGTDSNGHLTPSAFTCVCCGQPVQMNDMILLPAPGIEEQWTTIDVIPWLKRNERGLFRAWFSTVGLALINPGQLLRRTPPDSPLTAAWWFAVFTAAGTYACAVVPLALLGLGIGAARASQAAPILLSFGILVLLPLAVTLGLLAVWGLVAHGLLRASGRCVGPLGRTYQALCYSSGANLASGVPCLGIYLGWIWWLVSAVLAVKEAHRVSGRRAAFAVLLLPVLLLIIFASLYLTLVYYAVIVGTAQRTVPPTFNPVGPG